MRLKGLEHPIAFRDGTSDPVVLRAIFSKEEYGCVQPGPPVRTIIDCGANIGCTAVYFLHKYPDAHVIAIEPDPDNFAVCKRNLQPFQERVTLLNAAIWPTITPMKVVRGDFGDGREWSFRVEPCREGETADFASVTMDAIMKQAGFSLVDILKIDIEGSERALFQQNSDKEWLSRIRHLVIELHGSDCETVFYQAMSSDRWKFEKSGDLTICQQVDPGKLVSC